MKTETSELTQKKEEKSLKQKNPLCIEKYKEILNKFVEKFPNTFSFNNRKLLKIGIREDLLKLQDLEFSQTEIKNFLKIYCSSKIYRKSYVEGAARCDLEGKNVGTVTSEEIVDCNSKKKNDVERT